MSLESRKENDSECRTSWKYCDVRVESKRQRQGRAIAQALLKAEPMTDMIKKLNDESYVRMARLEQSTE